MVDAEIEKDGHRISLSGDQVKLIRSILGEGQREFGKRFAVTGTSIFRLESKGEQAVTGPLVILIDKLAKDYAIQVPERVIRRP